jgi:MFS family permease
MTTLETPPLRGAPADDAASDEYNLARRVYEPAEKADSAASPGGPSANGNGTAFNLAARVYGDPDASATHRTDRGVRRGTWNLSERVYDGSVASPAVATHTNGALGASPRNAAERAHAPGAPARGRFSIRTFESLNDRNFRWYFFAMFGQFFAMQMQMFVRGFLVFDLTGSFAALGTVSLANAIPGLTLSLAGGVVADRLPKRVVLQAGQVANMVMAAGITYLLYMDQLRFEHLLLAAVVQGTSNAMTMPSRQSMVPELVGPKRLMNAVALNTAGMNFTRLVAPALGGLIVAWTSATGAYTFMTASYLFAVLTLMKVPARPLFVGARPQGRGMRARQTGVRDLLDGLRYIRQSPVIRTLLVVNFLIVLVSMPYMMMLPGFAKDVLDADATGLGILMSLTGVGSLAGSLVIASLPSRSRGKLLLGGSMLLGAALLVFSASTIYWFSAAVMIVIGVGQASRMSLSNVLIQAYVDDDFRGRVMSIYMMEFSLTMFGVFAVGILAGIFGVQVVIGGTAVLLIVLVVLFYLFVPRIRSLD